MQHYANHQARLLLKLDKPFAREGYVGIVITNDKEIKSSAITLYDENGGRVHRYYLPIKSAGTNLILISPEGFSGVETFGSVINELHMTIYTSNMESVLSVRLDGIYLIPNNAVLYNLL